MFPDEAAVKVSQSCTWLVDCLVFVSQLNELFSFIINIYVNTEQITKEHVRFRWFHIIKKTGIIDPWFSIRLRRRKSLLMTCQVPKLGFESRTSRYSSSSLSTCTDTKALKLVLIRLKEQTIWKQHHRRRLETWHRWEESLRTLWHRVSVSGRNRVKVQLQIFRFYQIESKLFRFGAQVQVMWLESTCQLVLLQNF